MLHREKKGQRGSVVVRTTKKRHQHWVQTDTEYHLKSEGKSAAEKNTANPVSSISVPSASVVTTS